MGLENLRITTLIITCLLYLNTTVNAQYSEVGVMLGATNYLGDLVPPQQYFLGTNLGLGATYQYNFTDRIAVRGAVIWGQLTGSDKNSTYESGRRQRNLSFKSHLVEFSVLGQVNILPFHPKKNFKPITPYVFAGIAVFHFNPTSVYKNELVYLQPLGTEGQGMDGFADKYSLWEISIPAGIGVKFCVTKRINLSFEFGLRKTFTDYIDDVSGDYVELDILRAGNGALAANLSNRTYDNNGNQIERVGNPRGYNGKDWYSFMGVSITYSLHKYIYFEKKRKKRRKTRSKDSGQWM